MVILEQTQPSLTTSRRVFTSNKKLRIDASALQTRHGRAKHDF
jgi:hypothetical protein